MILPLGGRLIVAYLGAYRAKKRGGSNADMAQWAIVFGLILGVIGMFAMIIITRIFA